MADIAEFRENIINSGYVLDPEGTHHEFVSGMHGRKLDFDNIGEEDALYSQWTEVAAEYIEDKYDLTLPEAIVGVANGTNRLALDTARRFGGKVIGLVSEKDPPNSKKLWLSSMTARVMSAMNPERVVILEDVGTTGSNSVQVAEACLDRGAKSVEVITTWQRREKLERLEEANIPYRAIINEPLTTYTPEECQEEGFCSKGWEFIERSK